MESETCFGKIMDVINGGEYFIKSIPCALGRTSSRDTLALKDKKAALGKTIEMDLNNYYNVYEICDYNVKNKLIIENCKRICPIHFIIFFDFKSKEFKLKPMGPCLLNTISKNESSDPFPVKSYDAISIDCQICRIPHVYVFVFPILNKQENLSYDNRLEDGQICINFDHDNIFNKSNKLPDIALSNKWTSHEKDCLKKYLLIYGYGRWRVIKQNSGGVLSEKPESEVKIFSNGFVKTIIELLPQEKNELRKFLINLIDESQDDSYILPKKDDWGTLIKQRAPAWGKRIQLLCRVCLIVEKFKKEGKKNKEIRKLIEQLSPNPDNNTEEIERLRGEINKTYDHWDNLLNFLPNHAFYGQRPSIWWTRSHDIDLLRGTYKYGYANYQIMRSDSKLSFSKLEKDSSFQEFPNADTITRRLKKLIQIIIKSENTQGVISFDDKNNIKEPTGFTLEEKQTFTQFLIDFGVPLNNEGKSDWASLKDQLVMYKIKQDSSHSYSPQSIERLVQRLRMISQLVIQLNENSNRISGQMKNPNENDGSVDDNILEQMDPDNDGFRISLKDAERLNKNMNILHFIRKYILSHNCKLFNNGLRTLTENTKSGNSFPVQCQDEEWECAIHDKALLKAVDDNGLSVLHKLAKNSHYGFENINYSYDDLLVRINYLCEFFRDFSSGAKMKKKRDNYMSIGTLPTSEKNEFPPIIKRKALKLNIQKDDEGNLIYPIIINSSLQILNIGTIESERPAYHTEKNLFPIGYKVIREHASMFKLGERSWYTCEILDGGAKPIYKLTPHEDEENPIIRESSTGCWIVVCNKINALQGNKRSKVTISGTERFGLCENNVVRLLQSLPNSDRCSRYIFKNFEE